MKSERGFLKTTQVVLIAVVGWVALAISSEVIGGQFNEVFGEIVGPAVLFGVAVGIPLALLVWLALYLRNRRAELEESEEDTEPARLAPQLAPPAWYRPDPVHGRDSEVDSAVSSLRANGIVAVVGPRDIGTSAVAATAVQRLIDKGHAGGGRATRFDLRSRSSRRPDDARATAGRVVSAFGLDEPADATDELLADAGRRLVAAVRDRYDVLMLDNASVPEEIEWLVRQWPRRGRPWLVIAGESAIEPVVEHCAVLVGRLDLPALRAMWEAEVPSADTPRWQWLRHRLPGRGRTDELDALLRACFGRPRALKAFAREISRPDSTVTLDSLLVSVGSSGVVDGPLERVWTAILDHARDGLSPDAVWLLHALTELPVTALSKPTVTALLGARPAEDPLEELRIRNLVQETEDGRYRLPMEVRRAIAGTTGEPERRAYGHEAVPALLRHYAQDAESWAIRFGSGSGAAAVDWFHDEELTLRPLLSGDTYPDERLLELVIDDLARIADALEAWYVREQQSGGLLATGEALYVLAERANRPELAGIAEVRMATAHRIAGRLDQAEKKLGMAAVRKAALRHDQAAELALRELVERALLGMAGAEYHYLLPDVETELRGVTVQPSHPGAVATLLDLGAVCLHRGRPREAAGYLRRAELLATERRDIGSRAHAVELRGVALSCQDSGLPEAARLWWHAKELFVLIEEEQGEARCLQHLGSAALTDTLVAGQIRGGSVTELSERAAAEVALPLLERAKALRSGQPDTRLVDHYLRIARARLSRPDLPTPPT